MPEKGLKILITGLPGCGKTTLVESLIQEWKDRGKIAGFITREIRERGQRRGFELISPDGPRSVLSHIDLKTFPRVGKYGVDIENFEKFLSAIPFTDPAIDLVVIDEIGKMECLSDKFRKIILELIENPRPLLATIAFYGTSFIEKIKSRPDVEIIKISAENIIAVKNELSLRLGEFLKKKQI